MWLWVAIVVILFMSTKTMKREIRHTMATHTMEPLQWLRKQLEAADPDLVREMVRAFAQQLMNAEVEAICGAAYQERTPDRLNARNGYRPRVWDTRVGTVELGVPKLREGSYFPDWLLVPRRRAEQALTSVIADAYLAGVSTRRVEKLCAQLGIDSMSKSQVSRLAADLDEIVEQFRSRPLDQGPYCYLSLDALVVKVRDGGRIVNACVVHAVAVNRDGYRESLGLDVVTAEDGASWTAFVRSLVARGLSGVRLVTSDAHPGLVDAIAASLPGASEAAVQNALDAQSGRPRSPRPPKGWSRASCVRSSPVTTPQPSPHSTGRWLSSSVTGFPTPPSCSMRPAPTSWPSLTAPKSTGARSGRTTPWSG